MYLCLLILITIFIIQECAASGRANITFNISKKIKTNKMSKIGNLDR